MECFRNKLVHRFLKQSIHVPPFSHFWLFSFWANMNNPIGSTQNNKCCEGLAVVGLLCNVLLPRGPTWEPFVSKCPSLLGLARGGQHTAWAAHGPEGFLRSHEPHESETHSGDTLGWAGNFRRSGKGLTPLQILSSLKGDFHAYDPSVCPRGMVCDPCNRMFSFPVCLFLQHEVEPCNA